MRFALHFQENMYALCIKEFGCWDSYQNDALQATPQMPKSTTPGMLVDGPSQTCEQKCQKQVLVQLPVGSSARRMQRCRKPTSNAWTNSEVLFLRLKSKQNK